MSHHAYYIYLLFLPLAQFLLSSGNVKTIVHVTMLFHSSRYLIVTLTSHR